MGALMRITAKSVLGSLPTTFRFKLLPRRRLDVDLGRPADDVEIGQDVSLGIQNHAAADPLHLFFIGARPGGGPKKYRKKGSFSKGPGGKATSTRWVTSICTTAGMAFWATSAMALARSTGAALGKELFSAEAGLAANRKKTNSTPEVFFRGSNFFCLAKPEKTKEFSFKFILGFLYYLIPLKRECQFDRFHLSRASRNCAPCPAEDGRPFGGARISPAIFLGVLKSSLSERFPPRQKINPAVG